VVTRGHPVASYVADIPAATARTDRQEADMTITPSTLIRAAAAAAVVAGLIFIGVQINHPPSDVTSTATTEWVVRQSLKLLMAVLALAGITGLYLRQVRQTGVLGLVGYLVLAAAYVLIFASTFVPAYVLPSLADTDPGYVDDYLTAATGRSVSDDIGLVRPVLTLQGLAYLAGGVVFGVALFRARIVARWAAVLLAVGGLAGAVLSMMPDALYRFLAVPNAIALIALGYSLWRSVDSPTPDATSVPTDDSRVATAAGAE
jgi:hypothetical protein